MRRGRGLAAVAAVGLAVVLVLGLDRDAPPALGISTRLSGAERAECSRLLGRSVGYEAPPSGDLEGLDLRQLRLYRFDPGYAQDVGDDYFTASSDTTIVEAVLRRAGLRSFVTIRHVPFSECQMSLATSRASHLLNGWPHGGTLDLIKGEIQFKPADPTSYPLPAPSVVAAYERAVAPIPVDWSSPNAHVYEGE